MRAFVILLLLIGCGATPEQALTGVAAVGIGSIAILQRSPVDAVVSIVSGRDCSIVRWDRGKSYCRPVEPPPEPPEFCTRSLGVVDCWRDPGRLSDNPREVADGPRTLTPQQETNRTRGWPEF